MQRLLLTRPISFEFQDARVKCDLSAEVNYAIANPNENLVCSFRFSAEAATRAKEEAIIFTTWIRQHCPDATVFFDEAVIVLEFKEKDEIIKLLEALIKHQELRFERPAKPAQIKATVPSIIDEMTDAEKKIFFDDIEEEEYHPPTPSKRVDDAKQHFELTQKAAPANPTQAIQALLIRIKNAKSYPNLIFVRYLKDQITNRGKMMAPLLDLIKKLEKTRKDRYDITDRNLLRYTNQMLEKLDKKIQSFAPKLKFFCTPKKETSEKDIYLEIQAIITKAQKELPLYKKMQELLLLRQKAKEAEEARAPRPSSLTRYY